MKSRKIIIIVAMMILALPLASCERQCVCYNYTLNTSSIISSSYSKDDCKDWDTYYNTDIHVNPYGHDIECIYEKK